MARELLGLLLGPLLAGLGTALASAQEHVDRLVAQLQEDRPRIAALRGLQAVGGRALPSLMRDLDTRVGRGEHAAAAHVLLAIGRMGSAAAPATRRLCAHLQSETPELLVPLLRTIGSIGPAAVRDTPDVVEIVTATKTPTGRARQEWDLARMRLMFAETTPEQRLAMFGEDLVPSCALALWISEDPARVEGLQEALLQTHRMAAKLRAQAGWQVMAEETALALVRTTSDTVQQELAWGCLLGYFDPVVRLDAAVALRRDPGAATTAVPALIAALADGERAVLREVMITLGFFSDEAMAALPVLARWRDSEDAELQRVAAAASQGIRHNLSEVPATVADLLDCSILDTAPVLERIASFGPRARLPLEALRSMAKGELQRRCAAALASLQR